MIKARKLTQAQERLIRRLREGRTILSPRVGDVRNVAALIEPDGTKIDVPWRTIMSLRAKRILVQRPHDQVYFEYKLREES